MNKLLVTSKYTLLTYLFTINVALAKNWGTDFTGQMNSVSTGLINTVLPAIALLGILYGGFLAITGDGSGKPRIIATIGASLLCLIAPALIQWLKTVALG